MSYNSQYVEVFNEGSNFVNQQPYTIGRGINTLRVRIQQPDGMSAGMNRGDWSFLLNIQPLVKL
jgi:hypothetical protein